MIARDFQACGSEVVQQELSEAKRLVAAYSRRISSKKEFEITNILSSRRGTFLQF